MSDNPNFPVSTSACSWFDKSGQLHIRVYSSDNYEITERCNDGNGWVTGTTFQGQQSAVTTWADSAGQHLRVYVTGGDTTTEWCRDPGTSGWTKGIYTQP